MSAPQMSPAVLYAFYGYTHNPHYRTIHTKFEIARSIFVSPFSWYYLVHFTRDILLVHSRYSPTITNDYSFQMPSASIADRKINHIVESVIHILSFYT
jgi:hypothetical protein